MVGAVAVLAGAAAVTVLALRRRYAVVTVGGGSMRPTYRGGERVLVRRSPPATLERGRVVVVEVPVAAGESSPWHRQPHGRRIAGREWMIKRAAAVPGDATPAPFANAPGVVAGAPVPAGHLLVAGDNTPASYDSRVFGYVPAERVLGVVLRTLAVALLACWVLLPPAPASAQDNVTARAGGAERIVSAEQVPAGHEHTALSALEGGGPRVARLTRQVAQSVVDGVLRGSLIALVALGLSLVFRACGLVHFAHAQLAAWAATTAFLLNTGALGPPWHLVPAALAGVAVGVGLGVGLERVLWRPLRARGAGVARLHVVAVVLALFLQNVLWTLRVWWAGTESAPFRDYALQSPLQFGPLRAAPRDLVLAAVALAVLAGAVLALDHARAGKAVRAVGDDVDLAQASGVDVRRVLMAAWLLGSGLAALGGVAVGVSQGLDAVADLRLLLLVLAAVVVGGLDSTRGVIAGSLLVGVAVELSARWLAQDLQLVWVLLLVALAARYRPGGLLGGARASAQGQRRALGVG